MADQIQPGQHNNDELDVEELEQASGGGGLSDLEANSNSGCPNTNCPCSPA